MANKACPVTREQFKAGAKPLAVSIGGQSLAVCPKEFSTGSFGFYGNGKIVFDVGGVAVQFQVGITLTAVGSKDSPSAGA